MVYHLDNVGGYNLPLPVLRKYFPAVIDLIGMSKFYPQWDIRVSQITIDDMTAFTKYVETNNQ